MLVLCLLAVVRTLRYTHWLKFHQVLSIVFLGLTLHCVRLMDTTDFMMSFDWLNLIITVAGSVAAQILLFRGPGAKLREEGTIVETACEGATTRWVVETPLSRRVLPGQFVFAATEGEPLHPFSVAGIDKGRIMLLTLRLGDYTGEVVPNVPKGMTVRLEGPWGAFRLVLDDRPQTWVAGGIAPFMTWLEAAAKTPHSPVTLCWCIRDLANSPVTLCWCIRDLANSPVTLCWCIRDLAKEGFADEVKAACERAGVTLRIFESRIRRATPAELLADSPACGLRKAWRGALEAFMMEEFRWRHSK